MIIYTYELVGHVVPYQTYNKETLDMVLQKCLLKGFWSLAFIIHILPILGIQVSSLNAKTEDKV